MFGFLSGLPFKAIAYGLIVLAILAFANKLYNYHIDTVKTAIETTKTAVILEQIKVRDQREAELQVSADIAIKVVEADLKIERDKINKLERQLLIDHDLDRLLQRKPGLILNVVNKGTEKYLGELKELTQ